ncbi:unnamed protein product [Lampetra planeri]
MKRRNVPVDSEQEIAAPPVDPDNQLPSVQEGKPGEAEAPSPAQEWKAVMAQWEAKLAVLMASFDRFTTTASPTESSQPQPAPAMPVVAVNAAAAPTVPQAAPDATGAPESSLSASKQEAGEHGVSPHLPQRIVGPRPSSLPSDGLSCPRLPGPREAVDSGKRAASRPFTSQQRRRVADSQEHPNQPGSPQRANSCSGTNSDGERQHGRVRGGGGGAAACCSSGRLAVRELAPSPGGARKWRSSHVLRVQTERTSSP